MEWSINNNATDVISLYVWKLQDTQMTNVNVLKTNGKVCLHFHPTVKNTKYMYVVKIFVSALIIFN